MNLLSLHSCKVAEINKRAVQNLCNENPSYSLCVSAGIIDEINCSVLHIVFYLFNTSYLFIYLIFYSFNILFI
jgi:hypothetical protein